MTYTEDLNRMLRYSIESLQKENQNLKQTIAESNAKIEVLEQRLHYYILEDKLNKQL